MVGCVMPVNERLHFFTLNDEENEKGMKFHTLSIIHNFEQFSLNAPNRRRCHLVTQ